MAKVWEVIKNEDGTFDFFLNGELLHRSIPDRWLETQLGRYGFCGPEYRGICDQLNLFGRVKLTL